MILESLQTRRSRYQLNKDLPLSQDQVIYLLEDLLELVPDAFNMKSSKVLLAFDQSHDQLWDQVSASFNGKVPQDKIKSFKAAAGTILFFIDQDTINQMKKDQPIYAHNMDDWAQQASGMLQISVWTALAELGVGANIQHYNPLIDQDIKKLFQVPDSYQLVAQMPFGGIVEEPPAKEKEFAFNRIQIFY